MYDFSVEQAVIVIATKQLVDWLLSLNTHNRKIKPTHIKYIRNQINNNNWFLTNQGIGVSKKGVITDGQHRLVSLAEEGYPPVKILIVFGLDEKAQSVVDTHAKRSQSDVIRLLLNRTVHNQAVAAINATLLVKTDGVKFTYVSGKTDTFEVADIIANDHELISSLFLSCGTSLRSGVIAALMHYAKRYSLDHACALGTQIKEGVNLNKDDPAYRLRDWLSKNKYGGARGIVDSYSVTVSACIAHAKGETMQLLRPASSWARLPKPPEI